MEDRKRPKIELIINNNENCTKRASGKRKSKQSHFCDDQKLKEVRIIMKKLQLAMLVSASFVAAQARADLFDITFLSNDGSTIANAVVSGTPIGGGVYEATGGSIQITGNPAFSQLPYSLIPNPNAPSASYSPSGYFIYDNNVLTGQNPFLSNSGLLFGDGYVEINLFSNGASQPVPDGTYQLYQNNGANRFGDATISAVPEPTTVISGVLMLLPFGTSTLRILRKKVTA